MAHKLAKKKPADLKLLHQILFRRRGKVGDDCIDFLIISSVSHLIDLLNFVLVMILLIITLKCWSFSWLISEAYDCFLQTRNLCFDDCPKHLY